MDKGKRNMIFLSGFIILALLVAADLLTGDVPTGDDTFPLVLRKLRIPRVATAILAGGGLAVAGCQMQSIFRNPLADPHIMGISSGASLGAAIAILALPAAASFAVSFTIAGAAFIGAAAVSALVISISRRIGNTNTLLIFGVMLGFILSAVTNIMEYSANEQSLKQFYNWSAGSFSGNTGTEVLIMLAALVCGLFIAARKSKSLDICMFGDEYAASIGADNTVTRRAAIVSCCIITGAATAFCGPIGFVGIVSPHIARRILGTSAHKDIIPASLITGSCMAVLADELTLISRIQMPVGSMLAVLGIPVILFILIKGND